MRTGKQILALSALVLILTGTAEVKAQHSIRQAGSHGAYRNVQVYQGGGHADCGCAGEETYGVMAADQCNRCNDCCSPCIRLCLPNPCAVVDRVGTALYGLRELFSCRCCCEPCVVRCSDCPGTIQGEIPYLDHPRMVPMQPQYDEAPEPTPAASAASRSFPTPSNTPRTAAQAARDQRYPRASNVQAAQGLQRLDPPRHAVQRTSYKLTVKETPATESVSPVVEKKSDNPLR